MVTTTITAADGTVTSYTYSASASSIDSDTLIEAAVNARMQAAYTLADKVEANETLMESYTELQNLLSDLQDSVDTLRNSQASSDQDSNAFKSRAAYLTVENGAAAGTYLDVTVDAGTETSTYDIEIQQIATAHKVSGDSVADASVELGYDGTFTLGLEGGDSAEIEITSDMSLQEIRDAINAYADSTNIKASLVKVSETENVLILTAQDTGKEIVTSSTSGNDVLNSLGITDGSGDFGNVLTEVQDAIVVVDGLAITRDSNEIDDVIDGVTFHLYAPNPGTNISVEISENVSDIKTAITDFIDAYNAYRAFVIENQAVDTNGLVSDDAILFGDSYLRSASLDISSIISDSHSGISLRDLGIDLDKNNYLIYDEDELNGYLLSNLDNIKDLFAAQLTTSSNDLGALYYPDSLGDADFTLDIEVDADGKLTSASIGGDSSLFTVSGASIKGAVGSIYEGMTLVYTGTTNQSINVSYSEGIAQQFYSMLETYADEENGSLASTILDLEEQNKDYGKDITAITERAEIYRATLAAKYAAMELAYQKAEILKQQLEAYANANNDD
jgi:flagellar hook-associated protein 2